MLDTTTTTGPPPVLWDNRIVRRADVPPGQLLANSKNYRKHPEDQKAAFRALVAEVGYIDPVLCRQDDTIIDGHLRVEVALEDGIATIPVDYYDGTDAQSDLILATKDPIAAMAYHDEAATTALLDELGRDHEAALQALLDSLRSEPPPVAPEEFAAYDEDLETAYCCPKCGYEWSGKPS